jgi:hypothetical protein
MQGEVINGGILSFLTGNLKEYVASLTEQDMALSEDEMEKQLRPSYIMYALKRSFWERISEAGITGKTVKPVDIYQDVCGRIYFSEILKNKKFLAWLLLPNKEYDSYMMTMVDMAMSRYKDLMSMEITVQKRIKNEDGEFETITQTCPKKAFVLLQTIKQVEDRSMGKPVERQININSNASSDDKVVGFDMDKINARLKELETRLGEDGASNLQPILIGHSKTVRAGEGDDVEWANEE